MSFERFLIWNSGGSPVRWSETIYAILKEGILGSIHVLFVLFVFVALRPMSTAMVIAGRSVHLTTLFHGQA